MKKKVLYISQAYPYPAVSGGRIKTLNTLLALSKRYTVHAVFISEEKPNAQELSYMTKRGIRVKIFYSSDILSSVKDDLWGMIRKFLHGIPHYVFQYTHASASPFISNIISLYHPDIIHIDHLNMAQYLPKQKKEQWILEHHNVETCLYWTRFVHTMKPTRKLYLLIEMILTFFYEYRTLRKFDHIFAISRPEEDRARKLFGVTRISTQPMVYPPAPVRALTHPHPGILFVGILGWPPNEDAVEWFVHAIFPIVRKQIPDAEFHIVGRLGPRYNPPPGDRVVVHGFQKDLKPFLAQSDVFVLPFRMGGGLRLKALTALSAGLPVVTTPLGVEGLNVQSGFECLIANDAMQFAREVISVLNSPRGRANLRSNALRYVAREHGEENNDKFLREYTVLIR